MDRLAALLRRSVADPRSDGQLLAAFLTDRDEFAFGELVRRHGPLVWGVCRRTLPDHADAEDAFQATFLVLVRRAARLTANPTVGPWLFKVAAWTARNARRKNARRLASFTALPDATPDPQPDSTHSLELDDALLSLSERCRAAVLLCHLEGLTHGEAAKRLGCAEGTVSSLVSRGLAKLRTKFADPVAVLVAVAVPASVSAATLSSVVTNQLASLSAAASPAVIELTQGVLRMFWVKKTTAVGLAAALLLATGVGIGVSVRAIPYATAQQKPEGAQPDPSPQANPDKVTQIEAELRRIEDERKQLQAKLTALDKESNRLSFAVATHKNPRPDGPHFVLRLGGGTRAPYPPFTLTEYETKGVAAFSIEPSQNLKPIRKFLERIHEASTYPTRHMTLHITTEQYVPKQVREAVEVLLATGFRRIVIVLDANGKVVDRLSPLVTETIPVADLWALDLDAFVKFMAEFRTAAAASQKLPKFPVRVEGPWWGLRIDVIRAGAVTLNEKEGKLTLTIGGTARVSSHSGRITGVTVKPDPVNGNMFTAALGLDGKVTITALKAGQGTVLFESADGSRTMVTVHVTEK